MPFIGDVDRPSVSVLDVGSVALHSVSSCARQVSETLRIDYSEAVISRCQSRKRSDIHSGLVYRTMDARKLSFSDNTFDVILDKGTLDAMLSAGNGWQKCSQ